MEKDNNEVLHLKQSFQGTETNITQFFVRLVGEIKKLEGETEEKNKAKLKYLSMICKNKLIMLLEFKISFFQTLNYKTISDEHIIELTELMKKNIDFINLTFSILKEIKDNITVQVDAKMISSLDAMMKKQSTIIANMKKRLVEVLPRTHPQKNNL